MVLWWFKCITFSVHFISITIILPPPQIIRHDILEVGDPCPAEHSIILCPHNHKQQGEAELMTLLTPLASESKWEGRWVLLSIGRETWPKVEGKLLDGKEVEAVPGVGIWWTMEGPWRLSWGNRAGKAEWGRFLSWKEPYGGSQGIWLPSYPGSLPGCMALSDGTRTQPVLSSLGLVRGMDPPPEGRSWGQDSLIPPVAWLLFSLSIHSRKVILQIFTGHCCRLNVCVPPWLKP